MTSTIAEGHDRGTARAVSVLVRLWVWYLSLSEGRRFALVAAAAFLAIVARRPERLLVPEFYGEDGGVFYIGTYFGSVPEILFRSYAGYDNLLTRLLAFVERGVPVLWAPFVANLGAIVLVALLAALLASDRLRRVVPHPGMRLALAALLVFLPNSVQTLGMAADLMRYVPFFLLALALASVPSSTLGRVVDLCVAGVAALTGPASILMLPVFLWRAWREREVQFIRLTGVIAAGAMVQSAAILSSVRHPANLGAPLDLLRTFAFRTTVQSLLGEQVTYALSRSAIPLAIGLVAAVGVGFALAWVWHRSLPPQVKWPVMWTFIAFTLASAFAQNEGGGVLLTIGAGERYFVHTTALAAVVVVAGFVRLRRGFERVVATALAVMLSIGIGGDLRMFPFPTYGWPATSSCIGGKVPCDVDVFPPPLWTIHWPGIHGRYMQPYPSLSDQSSGSSISDPPHPHANANV